MNFGALPAYAQQLSHQPEVGFLGSQRQECRFLKGHLDDRRDGDLAQGGTGWG